VRNRSDPDRTVIPLVFLHGFTGAPESFEAVRGRLTKRAVVLAPPLLGHAGGPQSGQSFGGEVDRLTHLIEKDCPAPPVIVGYSMGARLALGIAAQQASLAQALLLISVNPGLTSAEERAQRVAADEEHAQFLEQQGTRAFIEQRWQAQALFASQRKLDPGLLATQTQQREQHSATGLAGCLRTLGLGVMPSFWDTLPTVADRVPLTLLTGALDEKFDELAARACTMTPKINWLSIPNAGHNLLLEAPEIVAHLIDRSLS